MQPDKQSAVTDAIVTLEWEMFTKVSNIGGRASCQNQPEVFRIMRESQLSVWTPEIQASYLSDLKEAKAQGRNLCTEKYGYMMESTMPEEYAKIRHRLPPVMPEKQELIAQMLVTDAAWEKETAAAYPKLCAHGRPQAKEQDTAEQTSMQTYLAGEWKTYSLRTLRLLRDHQIACREAGRNLTSEELETMMGFYGFDSLEAAEAALA